MREGRIVQATDGLVTNRGELVTISVSGEVASPAERDSPWRIGYDGRPRLLPGTGGIVLSHRVGDACVGLAGDHVEPGVSIRNHRADASNRALQTLACVGNQAVVASGRMAGAKGVVTGKHGGVETVMVDFPLETMRRMRIGDEVHVWACGLGLRFTGFPDVAVWNCSPRLLARWRPRERNGRIHVRVTHLLPVRAMGAGMGRSNTQRGDFDVQLSDPQLVRRYRLGTLRFGDLVAILDCNNRFGRSHLEGHVSIGVIVHGESTLAGHGPGVVTLLSGPAALLRPELSTDANIAYYLDIRPPSPAREAAPLPAREAGERAAARRRAAAPLRRGHHARI
jgi:hypothetical protein